MKTIILGSKGFVAKSLINFLKEKNIDHSSIGKYQINFLYSDSINKLKNKIRKLDNFNLIIISAIAPAKNIYDYEKNITILINIIKSINLNKIRKIIYISSDAVYNTQNSIVNDKTLPDPDSNHGIMHLCREKIIEFQVFHTHRHRSS